MKIFVVDSLFPIHSSAYGSNPENGMSGTETLPELGSTSPKSIRSEAAVISTNGSESPRSLREYHRGNGSLTGGGVQELYVKTKPWKKTNQLYETMKQKNQSMKKYKSKLDGRLGQCIFLCFLAIAIILCIYGVIHAPMNRELSSYINRTHQIAQELKHAMDENYPRDNDTDDKSSKWMTVEELEGYAYLVSETNSTIWTLFWWNVLICVLLLPILIVVHCKAVEGTAAKLVYRAIMVACLLFAVVQFLCLMHPILWGAAQFPGMIDRLFIEASPRDEYQIQSIQDSFACSFHPHETLVQFDLETPCIPKLKNSLFPTYSVLLLIAIDLFPFVFAVFIYSWDACLKNSSLFRNARSRIELNNSRRVPFPKSNVYVPPERNVKPITPEELPGRLV